LLIAIIALVIYLYSGETFNKDNVYISFFGAFLSMSSMILWAWNISISRKENSNIYSVVLFVIATPIIGATPSTVNLMRSLRLYDTFIGEFLRRSTFTNMYFLLFVAYFKGLSAGYSEAAEIDGASQLSIMFRIYVPLAKSMFLTIYLILFVAFWNDFTTPMMFLPSKPTLSYAIYYRITVDTGGGFADPVRQMAILMVFAIPIIVIFTIFNKQLMTNLTMGGMKE
jgi:ABC-type glycerol-3-phosphate transport system permease component